MYKRSSRSQETLIKEYNITSRNLCKPGPSNQPSIDTSTRPSWSPLKPSLDDTKVKPNSWDIQQNNNFEFSDKN